MRLENSSAVFALLSKTAWLFSEFVLAVFRLFSGCFRETGLENRLAKATVEWKAGWNFIPKSVEGRKKSQKKVIKI